MAIEKVREIIEHFMFFNEAVRAVVLATSDGLEYLTIGNIEGALISATSAVILSTSERISVEAGVGEPREVILYCESGYLIFVKVSEEMILCIIASPDLVIGERFRADLRLLVKQLNETVR